MNKYRKNLCIYGTALGLIAFDADYFDNNPCKVSNDNVIVASAAVAVTYNVVDMEK